jgi:3-hydroxyisobutyrate dehydrogenase
MTSVAVLGTGKMGAGMARQLVQHGHTVTVWNRNHDRAAPLADDGATVADDPAEAVHGAEVVLVVLFDAESVLEVLRAAGPGMSEQTVVVQTSTVGLDIDRVAEEADRLGVRLLDAPVLGTRKPAEDGTLTVLASGDPALREIADPVLDAIGARTVWAGDEVGAASRLKLVCNAFTGAQTAGTAQSIALAEGLGLDPQLFLDAISGGASDAPIARAKGAMMIDGHYPPAFDVVGLRKDLGLILEAAERAGIATELARALHQLAERAEQRGHGAEDMAAVRAAF